MLSSLLTGVLGNLGRVQAVSPRWEARGSLLRIGLNTVFQCREAGVWLGLGMDHKTIEQKGWKKQSETLNQEMKRT